jgi:hypothetical protein
MNDTTKPLTDAGVAINPPNTIQPATIPDTTLNKTLTDDEQLTRQIYPPKAVPTISLMFPVTLVARGEFTELQRTMEYVMTTPNRDETSTPACQF